jgi:hypothetical protein
MADLPTVPQSFHEFYEWIGHCITQWSAVENELFRICFFVINCNYGSAAIIYYRTPAIEAPAETLHIRRLENGLERPGDRSRPAPRHLASLVVADAFAGELTRGSFKTIPTTEETTNTQQIEEDSWLRNLDSNHD